MTRETKIGLLVGMGVIIVIGILISDHLSDAQRQNPAELAGDVPEIGRDMIPPPAFSTREAPRPGAEQTRLPMPQDVTPQTIAPHRNTPAPRPDVIRQNQGRELYQTMQTADETPPPTPRVQEPVVVDRNNLSQRAQAAQDNTPSEFVRVQDAAVAVEHARPIDNKPRQIIHYVKEGETLATIARQYYGDPLEYQRIVDANKKAIPNPNLIRPGVRLMIPPKGAPGNAAFGNVASSAPTPTKPKFTTYTLAEGDTLSDVAARYFGSAKLWQKVYELNKDRIDNPDRVVAGTELRVPTR